MTEINQNFSLFVQNDTEVFFDIGPDDVGTNLDFAQELTWRAYSQVLAVPDITAGALITKEVGSGIVIIDPLLLTITVAITDTDTIGMTGNYYHEIRIVDDDGKAMTLATGLMTVIDPAFMPNVAAFKAQFPEYETVDDTTVQIALDQAGQFVDTSWGNSQSTGQMYLAGHFMAVAHATSDTDGRAVTSETIGRMSISYATGGGSGQTNVLGTTRYGLVFGNMLTAQGFGIAVC